MIEITFTCNNCHAVEDISNLDESDLECKGITPVCDACYNDFLAKRVKLERSIKKLHKVYGIPPFPLEVWDWDGVMK